MIINESSIDNSARNSELLSTPRKEKKEIKPCLSDHPNVSAKRIRFGNKGTVDYDENEPVNLLTPNLVRVVEKTTIHV